MFPVLGLLRMRETLVLFPLSLSSLISFKIDFLASAFISDYFSFASKFFRFDILTSLTCDPRQIWTMPEVNDMSSTNESIGKNIDRDTEIGSEYKDGKSGGRVHKPKENQDQQLQNENEEWDKSGPRRSAAERNVPSVDRQNVPRGIENGRGDLYFMALLQAI